MLISLESVFHLENLDWGCPEWEKLTAGGAVSTIHVEFNLTASPLAVFCSNVLNKSKDATRHWAESALQPSTAS
jgi:hypothetical protein